MLNVPHQIRPLSQPQSKPPYSVSFVQRLRWYWIGNTLDASHRAFWYDSVCRPRAHHVWGLRELLPDVHCYWILARMWNYTSQPFQRAWSEFLVGVHCRWGWPEQRTWWLDSKREWNIQLEMWRDGAYGLVLMKWQWRYGMRYPTQLLHVHTTMLLTLPLSSVVRQNKQFIHVLNAGVLETINATEQWIILMLFWTGNINESASESTSL